MGRAPSSACRSQWSAFYQTSVSGLIYFHSYLVYLKARYSSSQILAHIWTTRRKPQGMKSPPNRLCVFVLFFFFFSSFRQLVWSGFCSNKQWPFQKASPWTGKSAILGRDLLSQTSWGWRGCDRVFALKSEQAGRGFGSFPWEQSPHVICASRNTRESKKFKAHVAHSTHVITERDRPRG